VSIGVTSCSGGELADTALQRADEAMYQAKERGRNRVEMAVSPAVSTHPPTFATPAAPATPASPTTLAA